MSPTIIKLLYLIHCTDLLINIAVIINYLASAALSESSSRIQDHIPGLRGRRSGELQLQVPDRAVGCGAEVGRSARSGMSQEGRRPCFSESAGGDVGFVSVWTFSFSAAGVSSVTTVLSSFCHNRLCFIICRTVSGNRSGVCLLRCALLGGRQMYIFPPRSHWRRFQSLPV